MNKTYSYLVSLLLILSVSFACSSDKSKSKNQEPTIIISEANPNGDSELALLMRSMFEEADSFRTLIADGEGNINIEFIEKIKQSHQAIPTKESMKPAGFDGYNQLLLNQALELLEADTVSADKFNAVVDRCMDCHHSICPGPTKRIQKLYIK